MWIDQRGSEVLPRNECLRLLAVHSGSVGRVGLCDSSRPVVIPVNYRYFQRDVLIRIGEGAILKAARSQSIIAFEVDDISLARNEAFSVLVQGPARILSDASELSAARQADPEPAVPKPGLEFVRILAAALTGRRFALSNPGRAIDAETTIP